MKHVIVGFFIAIFTFGTMIPEAEARRFGGGSSFGMQRQQTTPQQQPRQTQSTRQQAGNQSRSPMMGMIGGLAAGIGLAALFSHLGLGEELASLMLIALLFFAVLMLVRFLARRSLPAQQTEQGPVPFSSASHAQQHAQDGIGLAPPAGQGARATPADFDQESFERQAKLNFIRLQAAYDKGDLADIREFTAPEVFAEIRMQMADAPVGAVQHTEIVDLSARVIDVTEQAERYIVSVRFTGMLREQTDAPPTDFDEVWHLTKPKHGGGWIVAGIQQMD